jgi:transposase
MARKHPRYSPEFRAEAVRLATSSTESVPTLAKELGISAPCLRNWMKATQPPRIEPLTTDERTELQALRREVVRVREERDILKKATAFFAKHSE